MQLETKSLRKTINKAFLKETVDRSTFNHFKAELGQLLANIKSAEKKEEHEEHFKNLLVPFLNEVGFNDYYINTSVRIDLAIHTDGKVKDPIGVMLEVKRPSNKNEMITEEDFNRKAMYEAVLYYLEQRIEEENEDLKHIVITDTLNWFVFDAQEFERCYFRPSTLKKVYNSWKTDQKVSSNNDFMYDKIADFIDSQDTTVRGLHLNLQSFQELLKAKEDSDQEKKLIPLFKFFSPTQLLKEPFANDSNTLNREFYKELLYILGLEETTKSNTRYIERASEDERHPGSFIENTIRILDTEDHLSTVREPKVKYGSERDEQLFNVALELSIIWMNRVLFLKLLEAQLFRYHRQDKKFKFLKSKTIDDYDELNKLFFQVLARRESDRTDDINEKFGHIPYLNSSLFDPSSLEHQSVFISNLDDKKTLPVYSRSVLKDRRGDEINTLEYLFEFLDAYDFAAEGGEEIQEERKTLINASVLGLIFEKINGYKDGSFFTPGFITEYMARETLRKAISDKFAQHWDAEDLSFEDIYNRIGRGETDIEKANKIVNSITICDPAVGSGHFLVSCLNELLAIKSDLGILTDREGKLLRDVNVEVENDELIVTYSDEELFEYDVGHTWHGNHLASRSISTNRQRIQKALFHEKRHIIENCLFGVDINPNSVKICRLRLWIELLKNTYYTERSDHRELEVLPNIDINIKTGNSLVSRFDLDSDLSSVFKDSDHSLQDYKEAVHSYKQTGDRSEKKRLQSFIENIKDEYSTTLLNNDPIYEKLSKQRGRLELMQNADLFGEKKFTKKDIKKQEKKVKKIEKEIEDQESGVFYNQAFEWRFEFPEVLNEVGQFTGFDVVIGNPPYVRQELLKEIKPYLKDNYRVYNGYADLYQYFYEQSHKLLVENGIFSMITSNKYMRTNYGKPLRDFLSDKHLISIIDFGELPVFEEASTFPCIIIDKNREVDSQTFRFSQVKELQPNSFFEYIDTITENLDERSLSGKNWSLAPPEEMDILDRMNEVGNNLEKYLGSEIKRGILTGYNKAFIIDEEKRNELISEDPNSEEIINPFISGDDVRFYRIDFKNTYLITTKIGVPIEKYPAVKAHLDKHKKRLKKRYDQGDHYWELRACGYYDQIEKPKIIFPEIAKESRFTFDPDGIYINKTIFMIPSDDKYLLGLLNSKLIWFYLTRVCSSLGDPDAGGRLNLQRIYVSKVPIVEPEDKSYKKKIEAEVDKILAAKSESSSADTSEHEEEINQLVYDLYNINSNELSIVERIVE
jgi:hypothetical protein